MSLQALTVSKPDLDCYPPRRHVLGAVGGPPIIDCPKEQSDTRTVPSADDRRKEDPSFRGSSPEPVSSTGSHQFNSIQFYLYSANSQHMLSQGTSQQSGSYIPINPNH
ncbi:hypothetical protein CHARACLAT_032271 [Characodon lateralis]|uniref:Uncharacterized protein n=1 Tax=Characodon lateralis TaxID=208331 RepID=A0ABU7DBX2_9TELE|nr:hypothetical protein [Characodon lateralis]